MFWSYIPRRLVSDHPVPYAPQFLYVDKKFPSEAFVSNESPKVYFQPLRSLVVGAVVVVVVGAAVVDVVVGGAVVVVVGAVVVVVVGAVVVVVEVGDPTLKRPALSSHNRFVTQFGV
jgi:hypothetical protein